MSRLLTSLWSESLRADSIADFLAFALPALGATVPCVEIEIRRISPDRQSIATIARVSATGASAATTDSRPFAAGAFDAVARRLRSASPFLSSDHRRTAAMEAIDPHPPSDHRLLLPLVRGTAPLGVAIFVAKPRHPWRRDARAAVESFAEPFAAALLHHLDAEELAALRAAVDAERESFLRRLGRDDGQSSIVGSSTGLRHVMERVELVATTDLPTLILGETGSGKEVIARAIHDRSSRAKGPFLRVNCGALPPDLVDSELFGHEAGSFTGATRTRRGWFERADGGTLFLDEVGELPPPVQIRLLRVLQDGTIERVGGEEQLHVHVRVISATHRDLASMVRERTFREDLWYRLAVFQLLLPPLRERRDDIAELARKFAARAARRFGLASVELTESHIELLRAYNWPGNVRELASVIDRAVILGQGRSIDVAPALGQPTLRSSGALDAAPIPLERSAASAPCAGSGGESFDDIARSHICRVLRDVRGRIEGPHGAAVRLRVNPHTLRARMRKLSIDWAAYRSPPPPGTAASP